MCPTLVSMCCTLVTPDNYYRVESQLTGSTRTCPRPTTASPPVCSSITLHKCVSFNIQQQQQQQKKNPLGVKNKI
ncbi:hypothetical protein C4D60_Mb11t05220 [Musa balbisiana]|uniref:Uncharacterized protein n=1 Tax=Musa balbisiana TaxID=52838 RepID=A0A4S8J2Q7_MUSBA|nr:hypothetical protein C4D60_Mb11t05220 [Musa balbisiana]